MSKRDAGLLLQDILETTARIGRYVAGMDFDAFLCGRTHVRCGGAERGDHRRDIQADTRRVQCSGISTGMTLLPWRR